MRIFFKFILLFVAPSVFAQADTAINHEIYFGVNLTRLIVKDYELQLFYRLSHRTMAGISIGYDLNRGEQLFTDTRVADDTAGWHIHSSGSSERETQEGSRYFFGRGPAFRISCDFLYSKKQRSCFITTELMLKIRNYDNYIFQQHQAVFLESSSQKIYGVTIVAGRYAELESMFSFKIYFGFGFRYLISNVVRPSSSDYNYTYWYPEERFTYHLSFPTIHLGLSLIINPAATGVPKILK